MSKTEHERARNTVSSMTSFAQACRELGLSAKQIVLEAMSAGEDVAPYAQAIVVTARYDRPGQSNGY